MYIQLCIRFEIPTGTDDDDITTARYSDAYIYIYIYSVLAAVALYYVRCVYAR